MRFYPDADVNFYWEIPDGWDTYCRTPHKQWKLRKTAPPSIIRYWRDLEGAKKEKIKKTDLYFDNWITSRIDHTKCLPLVYSVGNRFIKIEQAPPAGFLCSPLPISLAEAREVRAKIKEAEKLAKKNKNKGKGKGKKKGKK